MTAVHSHLKDMDYSVVQQCMHCGLCLPTCPTYDATKLERNSPRGRISLMRAIADGRLEPTRAFADEMYFCLGCLACMTACPAGVNYAELFEHARAEAEQSGVLNSPGRDLVRSFTLRWLFMDLARLQLVGRGLRLYQQLGLQTFFRRSGFLEFLPKRLRELEAMTPLVREEFSVELISPVTRSVGPKKYRVAVLVGCAQDLIFSDVNRDTVEVLARNGCEVVTPPEQQCCGSLHAHNGEWELARQLARRNIDQLPPERFDAIITNAGGCGSHLKHYAKLLAGDSARENRAQEWDRKVKDIHEWLVEIGIQPPSKDQPALTVTYHESCHLCHGQRISSQPRQLLKAIPNLSLIELQESSWCCGSAGIYNLIQPKMADALLERKIKHIRSTDAAVVATGNPGCLLQILSGARRQGLRLRVVHPVTLLAEAYRRPDREWTNEGQVSTFNNRRVHFSGRPRRPRRRSHLIETMKPLTERSIRWFRCCAVWIALGCRLVCAVRGAGPDDAKASITPDDLMRHIRALSSDEFEGRAPGTQGEQLTIRYLLDQFKRMGLKPGNPDGTFVQPVPLSGIIASDVRVSYRVGDKRIDLAFPGEAVVWTKRFVPEIDISDSELVFVGYGVVAPEYGWDDFKGIDVRGKTIVVLINDPPVPDPGDPSKLDDRIFKGPAMTYYGRWTYKYELAAEKGAAAAIIVHETGPAGYPWAVVVGSNSRENFDLQSADRNMSRIAVEGWMTLDKAKELFAAAGRDFDQLKGAAVRRDFQPVSLGGKASFRFRNTVREVASQNVIAKLEGADPRLKDEYVIYTAHWDHLGRDPTLKGDQIFNGARDNASGTAVVLELAEAFTKLQSTPRRTVLFLLVTAEEKGLLGAKFYSLNPLYPIARTLADLNTDSANTWGRTRDVNVIGSGQSTLEDLLLEAATAAGRVLTADTEPEKGRYYRSDHFEFAKVGVPGLYLQSGTRFIGKPEDFGRQKIDGYTANDYHKVTDEIKPDWDLSGAAEDARLLFEVGWSVANGGRYPEWKPGSEFKGRREEMLKKAGIK